MTTVIFARWKLYKHIQKGYDEMYYHVEKRYWESWEHTEWRTDNAEFQITELGYEIREIENYEERVDLLHNYARRTQCGLILNGCLTEHEVPNIPTIIAYDTLQELNAGNFLARRSLEDMQATEGQYYVEGREQHHQKDH